MHTLTTADKIAMYIGGGLVLVGTFAIGLLEMLFGAGHNVTEDGQIVHDALVPLEVRSYVIILGLLIWGLYAVYKVVGTRPATPEAA
jgi:hypothetical protein